jgi:hypothetical protein
MKGLAKFLVETILDEAAEMDKVVVVYSGRFQPFHKGHYATYENLIRKFGKDSVYIGTSNVTDSKKSPFNFKEKKAIMMQMFGIPSSKIINIKNPYRPEEILNKYDSDTTGLIVVVGEKDQNRLSGKYFTPYKGNVGQGYLDKGYVYASPAQPNPISGTDVRYWLSAGSEEERKKNFTKAYPKFDSQIFKLITLKLKGLKECINEEIKLNVKVGDTLLMGKFKNKKVIVKSIGEDEWGMPTINGKKAVTFRIPKKEELKEAASNAGFSGTAEPDTSFVADRQKRILNKEKPENWYKQGGYTQLDKPKADNMRGVGKTKDTETQFRKSYYKINNVEKSTLNPADDPHKVEDWKEIKPKKAVKKPKRFWELPENQKDTIISKEDINEIIDEMESFILGEMAKQDLDAVEKYADNQLSPEDIELGKETDHFFQRLNDPRNGKPISAPELTGFFKRLARNKKKFIEFVKQYKEFVVNDTKTNINIAFMKVANKLIAKTVMRKVDFKSTSPIFKTETIDEMGLGGGAGVGLSLPGGYINGAPKADDVKKVSKKLNNKGMSGYEEIDEIAVQIDNIPGGLAKGMTLNDIAKHHNISPQTLKNEFIKGYAIEREHTTDVDIAKEIALDHLYEDPNYYSKLSKIEIPYNEAFTKGQLFAGKMKVGGRPVNVEVELVGSDNKTNQFITKIIYVDKGYERQLPIGSKLPIPARIFRTPGGGWRKIKTPSAFENVNEATSSEIIKDLDKVKTDLLKKVDVLIAKKKKLYSNVDIESPMSADEKKLDKDIADIFSQINQLVLQKRSLKKESINESLLLEGGAYGHMNHPFDIEMNLTFGDLKQIVTKALNGDLDLAREKTDGQALAISWVNGRLVAARNKSHTKNKGEGAMTIGQVAQQFAGRGALTDAYTFAMNDLSKAISALSEPQRKKIFKDGACFMNLEVIYPQNANVIPYGQPLLVFHGTFEYNKEGEIIGENQSAASILAGMIKQVNKHVQDTYTIQGPPMQSLPKSESLSKLQGKYISMINRLQKEFNLSDSDGVADYHQAWWTDFVEKGAKKLDIGSKIGLVKRWAFGDKSMRINQIQDDKIKAWADKTDKQDQQKIMKNNIMKFEEIFLGVGADVLEFMESVLTANPSDATKQLRNELGNAIKQIKASGNPQKIDKLKIELQRLNTLGGFDKIVPNEGIVFVYGGNTYKLTGAFAPLNQILGIFKYGR